MDRPPERIVLPITPLRALPVLMALNVVVYALWQVSGYAHIAGLDRGLDFLTANFLISTETVGDGRVWTLLSSAFSHQSTAHLAVNMLALWVFGQDVERVVGPRGFVHLYVGGGIVASLGHALYGWSVASVVPALGASGAVMAIAVVAALLFPRRLLLLFFIIPMPQIMAVGLFLVVDVIGLVSPMPDTIAHAAHLGGALYGLAWYRWHLRSYVARRVQALRAQPSTEVWSHPVA